MKDVNFLTLKSRKKKRRNLQPEEIPQIPQIPQAAQPTTHVVQAAQQISPPLAQAPQDFQQVLPPPDPLGLRNMIENLCKRVETLTTSQNQMYLQLQTKGLVSS